MKKILVPADFSPESEQALEVAASIAKKNNSHIYVLHMLELNQAIISSSEASNYNQTEFFIKLAEKQLSQFLDKTYLAGIEVTPIIKHYKVFGEINDVARDHGVNLIVMGSHGSEGLTELFVGSNAEKVVRTSEIPVLVVKATMGKFDPKQMVFACDLKDENLTAFNKAKFLAASLSAQLKMVYINTPGEDFSSNSELEDSIRAFSDLVGAPVKIEIYNDYSVEKGILNYADSIAADVIGIPTHGRTGLSHLIMGSIGEDVANHSKLPVITFKI